MWWPISATILAAAAAGALHGLSGALGVAVVGALFLLTLIARPVKPLRAGPLQWIGRRSYSLYLLHATVGFPAIAALTPLIGRDRAMLAAAAVSLVGAVTLYEVGEVRGTAWARGSLLAARSRIDSRRVERATRSGIG